MVGVDNDLEIVLQTPVHHFLDTCNPCLVNAHRHRVGDVALPTDRDSDGVETCVLHGLDGLLGHDGIAPRSFGLDTVVGHADKHRLVAGGCSTIVGGHLAVASTCQDTARHQEGECQCN